MQKTHKHTPEGALDEIAIKTSEACVPNPGEIRLTLRWICFPEPTVDPSVANCDFDNSLCLYHQERVESKVWSRVTVNPNAYRMGDHTTGTGDPAAARHHAQIPAGSHRQAPLQAKTTIFVSRRLFPLGKHALHLHTRLRGSASRPIFNGEPQILREVLLPAAGLQESGQRSDPVYL